ncbi:FAD/NAD-P-binding domain-containing protein [Mycena maculata]|uniref:FAD/NAD-P-binding domain-containing protein n=1 Tax=Mycena maculata TaxID=230809 RepID=A0AAD7IN18_9AGAR|nr:FAD/NAD-P-binding domain-containing protein [Mycena maculata]
MVIQSRFPFRDDERRLPHHCVCLASDATSTLASGFTFETAVGPEQGYFSLNPTETGSWRAMSVFMHTLAWEDVARERRLKIEWDPHVLIRLQSGARFKQMNTPALIHQHTRTFCIPHSSPRSLIDTCSALPDYSRTWPVFTPKDKLAHWLEQYAESTDLVVWTNSHPLPTPTYYPAAQRWTVFINPEGKRVAITSVHIVIAAGTLGAPLYPSVGDPARFRGIAFHAAHYHGGAPSAGQRVIDLSFHGARSVTMVQRSSACVVSAANMRVLRVLSAHDAEAWEAERETHRGSREAGLKLNMGPDGSGVYSLMFERFGGYWLDVGCAKLIREGKVAIKQGVEAARFTEDSLVFTDGSALPADVVIYATSYENIRDNMRALFSDRVIDQTSLVWGVDEEGELRGCYRAPGHPGSRLTIQNHTGLWFAAGNFAVSRFYSKQLALEIKAVELGLYEM